MRFPVSKLSVELILNEPEGTLGGGGGGGGGGEVLPINPKPFFRLKLPEFSILRKLLPLEYP